MTGPGPCAALLALRASVSSHLLWVAVLPCLPALASAEVYQWRDANGQLHFSDKKPSVAGVQAMTHRVNATNVDDSGREREKLGRLFKPETAAEKTHRLQAQERQARQGLERQQQCDSAREYLAVLQGRVYFVREDGSRYDISEAERAQQVVKMESIINQNCD
ncbi:DUF4124 domain-containing protein [Aestuariicella hydrocarbonica]|uniref:DUF4124 domain-containing protein n=1 Tax=Pseudomaricurvus hydrocarbonicus TaxID=1470433 RepID=A0A9E5MNZ4_9GAMM|nr:DUF4124 domain-containing protein [Aestuariicella hydrocarbonica]NHO67647.1 DUF4124 domain-containing protein [Aestuariicella hydrocarbonica]